MLRLCCAAVVLALWALGFLACGTGRSDLPVAGDTVSVPYQEFGRSTLFSYEGSYKKWKLEAMYMRKSLADTGAILVVPVVLSLYDSVGGARTRVAADSGTTTPSMESFTIWGDVYVRTKDSLVVRTARLSLDNKTRMWHSDTVVQIRTAKGDILQGKGFTAREDFSQSSFKESVSGTFPEFRERFEGDDRFF
jgi:LPS export ABC transporter protein LptC